ncbi:hypothetical protein Glove_307g41 [Diversispora epigaea]|uniref:C2H2-type domain-containing protein n=1 Tax=Diversispora epigaea TaxID=1348612 RepID=A0A397HY36_9GLOM|nr:hypothetical protein Glove_307g41 [Diversispora epigaea]
MTINTLQLRAHYEISVVSTTSQQCFICEICKKLYKTKRGLVCHQNIVKKYNVGREELYILPLEAINQFKADLVYVIGTRLKEHFKHSGKQSFNFPCLESLFFGVFKGYIHYFNRKNGSYKCFFQGPDTYSQLTNLFNNPNWGKKYFNNNQQTFVLLFDEKRKKIYLN